MAFQWSNKQAHKIHVKNSYTTETPPIRPPHRLKGSGMPSSSSVSNPIISITSRSSLSIPSAMLPITSRHWLRRCLQTFSARATSDRRFASSAGSITSALRFTPQSDHYDCRLATRSSIRWILAVISAIPFSNSASLSAESSSFSSTLQSLRGTNHSLAFDLFVHPPQFGFIDLGELALICKIHFALSVFLLNDFATTKWATQYASTLELIGPRFAQRMFSWLLCANSRRSLRH